MWEAHKIRLEFFWDHQAQKRRLIKAEIHPNIVESMHKTHTIKLNKHSPCKP